MRFRTPLGVALPVVLSALLLSSCGGTKSADGDEPAKKAESTAHTKAELEKASLKMGAAVGGGEVDEDISTDDLYDAKPKECQVLTSLPDADPKPAATVVRSVATYDGDSSPDTRVQLLSYEAGDAAEVMAALTKAVTSCASFEEEALKTHPVTVEKVDAPQQGDASVAAILTDKAPSGTSPTTMTVVRVGNDLLRFDTSSLDDSRFEAVPPAVIKAAVDAYTQGIG